MVSKEREQALANAALERAIGKVIRAYGLLPDNAGMVEWLEAHHAVCAEIMAGAFTTMREAIRGEAQERSQEVLSANDREPVDFRNDGERSGNEDL